MAEAGKRNIFTDACTLPPHEAAATASVRPGSFCLRSATGIAETTEAATVFGSLPLFADRNILKPGASVDDAIASGEVVVARQLETGRKANLLVAVGNNITKLGVGLASNGDGTLKIAATDDTERVVAYSDEIINVTGSAALVKVVGA